ncbi:MAG: hypothetical protein OXQ94_14285 [Gemmatimonadota bacterium]|nr:hypothetical protein [Gemmatimonadota bacterium]MDE2872845.1 hypothetical protein [Gemmatimonadota bacterium]
MAIGRRRRAPQQELFVATSDIRALDNPFYRALNRLLEEHGITQDMNRENKWTRT